MEARCEEMHWSDGTAMRGDTDQEGVSDAMREEVQFRWVQERNALREDVEL